MARGTLLAALWPCNLGLRLYDLCRGPLTNNLVSILSLSIGYLSKGAGISEVCPCSFWPHGLSLFRPPDGANGLGVGELLCRLRAISQQTLALHCAFYRLYDASQYLCFVYTAEVSLSLTSFLWLTVFWFAANSFPKNKPTPDYFDGWDNMLNVKMDIFQ